MGFASIQSHSNHAQRAASRNDRGLVHRHCTLCKEGTQGMSFITMIKGGRKADVENRDATAEHQGANIYREIYIYIYMPVCMYKNYFIPLSIFGRSKKESKKNELEMAVSCRRKRAMRAAAHRDTHQPRGMQ